MPAKFLRLTLAFVCLFGFNFIAAAMNNIDRVEPLNWWTNMAEPQLQLMVHGDDISSASVNVDYPGVEMVSVQRTDNNNYLFINLRISNGAKAGRLDLVFTQPDGQVIRYPYSLLERKAQSAARQGFSSKDAIYLLTPDRFANGDPSNDQVDGLQQGINRMDKGGRHGGDIQGIIDHLDYIQAMGFTQIWPMPLLQNDMPAYSYHGYSTTDYYQVDKRLGSNQLYQTLSQEAAKRGIGIIHDVILNHIGSQHWWMKDKPSADWINNAGVFTPTTHMREALHDPHAAQIDKSGFNDGWFVPTMPDLNQRNPLLATYLIQNAIWWIEYADLSGIRVDTYSYSDQDFLANWTKRLMHEYPNFNIVGEEWSVNPSIVAFWQAGSQRYNDYQSWLPSVMDFPNQVNLVNALTKPESWATGLRELYEGIASDFIYGNPDNLLVFADNHDMSRIYTQLNEDYALYKMAMSYLATVRGIPQLFYGTELLMVNPETADHGIIRADFPGGWPADKTSGFTGLGLTKKQLDAQTLVKALFNWRKSSQAVINGKMMHYAPYKGVYVYFRYTEDESVMIILNKNEGTTTLPLERFNQRLDGFAEGRDVLTHNTFSMKQPLTIPAKSSLILELR